MKNKFAKKLVKIGFISCMIGASASLSHNTLPSKTISSAYHRTNDISYSYDVQELYYFNINEHYNIKCGDDIYFVNVTNNESYITLRHLIDTDSILLAEVYVSYNLGISTINDDDTLGYYSLSHTYFTNVNLGDIEHGCLSDFLIHKIDLENGLKNLRFKGSYLDSLYLDNNIVTSYSLTGNIDNVPSRTISYIYDFYNVSTVLDIANYFDVFVNSINSNTEAYDLGYANGKDYGYTLGLTDGDNNLKLLTLMRAVFESPGYMLHNMFNFEIFGVNIFGVVSFFITIGIVLLVFSILRRTK